MPRPISEKKLVPISTRVSKDMNDEILKRVKNDEFKDRSDFVYRAIYAYLDELETRDEGREYNIRLRPQPRPDKGLP